jgi:hypothetical protein
VDLSLDVRVVASRDQVSCDLQGEVAILNMKNGIYYGLDPVGAHVWKLIQTSRPIRDIRDSILAEYDVDAQRCEHDLLNLLRDLRDQGLIEVQS